MASPSLGAKIRMLSGQGLRGVGAGTSLGGRDLLWPELVGDCSRGTRQEREAAKGWRQQRLQKAQPPARSQKSQPANIPRVLALARLLLPVLPCPRPVLPPAAPTAPQQGPEGPRQLALPRAIPCFQRASRRASKPRRGQLTAARPRRELLAAGPFPSVPQRVFPLLPEI